MDVCTKRGRQVCLSGFSSTLGGCMKNHIITKNMGGSSSDDITVSQGPCPFKVHHRPRTFFEHLSGLSEKQKRACQLGLQAWALREKVRKGAGLISTTKTRGHGREQPACNAVPRCQEGQERRRGQITHAKAHHIGRCLDVRLQVITPAVNKCLLVH